MTNANGTAVELRGVVRGRTIELEEDAGFPEGAKVTVRLKDRKQELTDEQRLELLKQAAGGWAGDDEEGLDEYLRYCREDRRASRPEIDV